MKKYLKYLLADIESAKKNKPSTPKQLEDSSEMFRGPEEYMNSPLKNMCDWFGLDARAFPPAERWNEEEILIVVNAMTELWDVYNYEPAFPEGVDTKLKYKLFVKVLTESVPWLSSGLITIDFCDSDVNSCALEEFCICREIVDFVDELPHKDEIIIAQPTRKVDISASMQRYYEQLLSDLNVALQNLPGHDDFDFEDDFEEEETYAQFENIEQETKPLAEWLNVPQAVFPKLEQLSTEMVIEVIRAIEKLWWHAGYVPFFPDGLNIEMKYQLFREQWARVVPWPSDESVYLGFCDDNEDNCIYGAEMCTCAKYKLSFGDEDDELDNFDDIFGDDGEGANSDLKLDEWEDEDDEDDGSLPF